MPSPIKTTFSKARSVSVLLAIFFFLVAAATPPVAEEAKRILALIDYIGGDYRNAVQGGRVLSADEYQEMIEFSGRALELFKQLKSREGADRAGIEKELRRLVRHVEQKSGESAVPELAQTIKQRLIATYNIATHPRALPDLETGRRVYLENCAQCHGETGRGDGPDVETMRPREPRPASFLDPDLMNRLSPFKAFNTATFGIAGTAMPEFSALGEEQRWQAAFYVMSLRFTERASSAGKRIFESASLPPQLSDVQTLATVTDGELREKLGSILGPKDEPDKVLAYLRKGLLAEQRPDPLLVARTKLKQALDLYRQGKRNEAYQRAVDAYLDGFELAEPAVFARDPDLGRDLEGRFTEFRASIRSGADISRIRELYTALDQGLLRVAQILDVPSSSGGSYTLFNAGLIIVREGVEALLIVSAIIAVLKATGASWAIRYIHLGWTLALASGILTWVSAQTVLTVSGVQREVVEGFTALLAAVVLFFVSYWLISKAEARRWQQYIQHKVQEALSGGRIVALVGVSFLAVYREAFETVLFYQALWLQSRPGRIFVIWGFLLGVAVLAAVVWFIFKVGMRIPLRLFFGLSSAVLYLLAFVFIGQGIKDLQATGWFPETPLNLPPIPVLGIYPTLETTLAQGAMILALIAALAWLWSKAPARANTTQR